MQKMMVGLLFLYLFMISCVCVFLCDLSQASADIPISDENFTTYSEIDPESRVEVTSDQISFTGVNFRGTDTYVCKDKGINYFDGDFEHTFSARITSETQYALSVVWMLANDIDDLNGIYQSNKEYLDLEFYRGDSGLFQLRIHEFANGIQYEHIWTGATVGTTYYLTLERDESFGQYGRFYCYIYSDTGRTNLLHTLQLDLHEKRDFRYIYALNTYNDGQTYRASGFINDLTLSTSDATPTFTPTPTPTPTPTTTPTPTSTPTPTPTPTPTSTTVISMPIPELLYPASSAVDVSLTPTFDWITSTPVMNYKILLAKNCDWDNPILNSSLPGGSSEYQMPFPLEADSNYCWKIRSENGNDLSAWSSVFTFTTIAGSVPTVIPLPTGGSAAITPSTEVPTLTPGPQTSSPTPSSSTPVSSTPTPTPSPTSQLIQPVSQIIGQFGGTVETTDGRVSVTFPAGTLNTDTQVTISSGSCHSSDSNYRVGDSCFSIAVDGTYAGLYGTTICIKYSDFDLSLVNGDTSLFTLGYYSGGTWHEVDNDLSMFGNRICCTTDHLSDWAILIKQRSESSIPFAVYIGGVIGSFAVIAILVLFRRMVTVSSESNNRIRRMKTQMNKWRGEGYDVSKLEDLFK